MGLRQRGVGLEDLSEAQQVLTPCNELKLLGKSVKMKVKAENGLLCRLLEDSHLPGTDIQLQC